MSFDFPEQTRHLIEDALTTQGYVILPHFITDSERRQLLSFCQQNINSGKFSKAAVGHGTSHQIRDEIRQDETFWLEAEMDPAARQWYTRMDNLAQQLNQALFLGLFSYKAHFARYAPGAFYARHLDRPNGSSDRILTALLYLNENWRAEDGGQLRLYLDSSGDNFRDILPEGGTFVLFLSDRFPHEVQPARRDRFSLSGWFSARAFRP